MVIDFSGTTLSLHNTFLTNPTIFLIQPATHLQAQQSSEKILSSDIDLLLRSRIRNIGLPEINGKNFCFFL